MIERKFDRVALITGAASGIGKATAERFAQESYTVYAVDKDPKIHNVFKYSPESKVIPMEVDVSDPDRARDMVDCVVEDSSRIDVVINAAGVMPKGKMSTFWNKDGTPTEALKQMDAVNVTAPIAIMMEASKQMHNTGGGTIVNITSAKYMWPDIHHSGYQDGKHLLSKVTKGMAKLFKKQDNVRLVDLQPGNTKTNIDRGVWIEGNDPADMKGADNLTAWWRNTFGAEPEKVADKIYDIAEGRVKGNTVRVGIDTHIGRFLYVITWPFYPYRSYILFGVGSHLIFEGAKWGQVLQDRIKRLKSSSQESSNKT